MSVALTRAERFLFVTVSARQSAFIGELAPLFAGAGAPETAADRLPGTTRLAVSSVRRDDRLVTSFPISGIS